MVKGMKKRLLSLLLALMMIGGMLPGLNLTLVAHAEGAAISGNWTDYAVAPALDPADSTNKTYIIESEDELAWFASQVNNNGTTFSGFTFKITANLDLSAHYWVPIGNSATNLFQGTVQGNNYEISGLTIGSAASPDTTYTYAGLFGYIKGATINNVALRNVAIYSSNSTYIGGLAGYMDSNKHPYHRQPADNRRRKLRMHSQQYAWKRNQQRYLAYGQSGA